MAFQFPTKRRDELVHRILNDIFREKVACLQSGQKLTRLRQSTVKHNYVGVLDALGGMRDTGFGYILCWYSVLSTQTGAGKGKLINMRP